MTANIDPGILVDNFCGGGGASLGISRAFGAPIDIAVNHDLASIQMHATNHPETVHLAEDVWHVKPAEVCAGRPVRLAWFSPDCTHHSKAKGGKPRSKKIRALAWIVVRWMKAVKPACVMLENVEEFADWCPLDENNKPIKDRRGETFRKWIRMMKRLGYKVEHRIIVAADFGAPTTRKRLYLIARCDGQPITWPEPTHAKDPGASLYTLHLQKWRSAAECIDWSLPCPSIFERKKPLAENTQKRIAEGIRRFVLECADPFIVEYHAPKYEGDNRVKPLTDPLPTQTTENRFGVVAPSLVEIGYGEREGQVPRTQDIEKPLGTVVSTGKHAVITPVLVGQGGPAYGGKPVRVDQPFGTILGENHKAVAAPILMVNTSANPPTTPAEPLKTITSGNHHYEAAALLKHYSGVVGQSLDKPLGTVTAVDHHSIVSAALCGVGGRAGQSPPRHPEAPMNTITSKGDSAIAAAHLEVMYSNSKGADPRQPMPTVTAQAGHIAEVRAFLTKYHGTAVGSDLRDPMSTATGKHRLGLVVIHGTEYQIVDIGLRMLQPRELARAQGFPDSYVLTGTKTNQVARIGNSVCPDVAEALVRANFPQAAAKRMAA